MSEFISCDAHPLQGSKQLLILDQALHHSLNGSIGFVVMIDLHEDYKVLEDYVDNHKWSVMSSCEGPSVYVSSAHRSLD